MVEPNTLSLVLVTPRQRLFERTLDLLAEAEDVCFRLSWARDLGEARQAMTTGCDLCLVDSGFCDPRLDERLGIQRQQVPIVALLAGGDRIEASPPGLPCLQLDGLTPRDAATRLQQAARPAPPAAGVARAAE